MKCDIVSGICLSVIKIGAGREEGEYNAIRACSAQHYRQNNIYPLYAKYEQCTLVKMERIPRLRT
jgi:hypothetical protein